ncbi:MAG: hypothetical protein HYT70_01050 [Candidatus Aenigmarchaeota archaeon]|nr:hypothetical protein [Candidatus Aenigmarchaeota archaeon]
MTTGSRHITNGLYIADFAVKGEEYQPLVNFLSSEQSCRIADNIYNPSGLLVVFQVYDGMNNRASDLYYDWNQKGAVNRVHSSGVLKPVASYRGLGGGFNWAKLTYPRRALEALKTDIAGERRIGETFYTEEGWLYSRVKIPESEASREIQELLTRIEGANSFRYLSIIKELKNVWNLSDYQELPWS